MRNTPQGWLITEVSGALHFDYNGDGILITEEPTIIATDVNNCITKLFALLMAFLGWGIVSRVYIGGDVKDYQMFWCSRSIVEARGEKFTLAGLEKQRFALEKKHTLFCHQFFEQARASQPAPVELAVLG